MKRGIIETSIQNVAGVTGLRQHRSVKNKRLLCEETEIE